MQKYFLLLFILFPKLINAQSRETILLGQGDVYDFRFSPQGSLAYVASGKSVNIWDIYKKVQIGSLEDGPDNTINSLDITKDSSFLVASSLDSIIAIWNLSNFTLLKKIKINSIANKVLFNDNGSSIVAGLRNGELLSINSFTGEVIIRKETNLTEVTGLALLDSSDLLAASGPKGIVQLWNTNSFTIYDQKKSHSDFVRELVFTKDGQRLYSCGDDGKVICCNIKNNKLGKGDNVRSNLNKPWIMSMDIMDPRIIAYADLRGEIVLDNYVLKYSYHLPNAIFKLHFLPQKSQYMAVGIATSDGLKIIWASKMKSKSI